MDKIALINKFFRNQCNVAEASEAFKILQDDAKLLDLVLSESEWDAIDQKNSPNKAIKANIWNTVAKETKPVHTFKKISIIYWAASIIMLLGISLFIKLNEFSPSDKIVKIAHTSIKHSTLANTSDHTQYYCLIDGSEVMLHPKSQITYVENFKNNRNIHLTGKAIFKVAKDSLHPFVVHSGMISTTALGTEFLVDYSHPKINIKLFEGKVLVQSTLPRTNMKEITLTPGEQCFVDVHTAHILVDKINTKKEAPIVPTPEINKAKRIISFTFFKSSLTEIFSQIESEYNIRIKYLDTDIHDKYFTGTFTEEESLESILQTITRINGLDIKINPTDINIFKNQELTKPTSETIDTDPEDILPYNEQIFFNQVSLKQLFTILEHRYQTKILFDPKDIENKFFTGEVSPDNDLSKFLLLITQMNGLKLSETSNAFRVTTNTNSQ